MDTQPPEPALELLSKAYGQSVQRHAEQAWHAGRHAEFLTMLVDTCFKCGVPPLSDDVVRRLIAAGENEHGEFFVMVGYAAAAVWERGGATALLESLKRSVDPDAPITTDRGGRTHNLLPHHLWQCIRAAVGKHPAVVGAMTP
jgi:hypothetical protein